MINMNIVRIIGALMLSLILLVGSVANAAAPCSASQADTKSASAMPCHQMEPSVDISTQTNQGQMMLDCSDCGCDHYVHVSILPETIIVSRLKTQFSISKTIAALTTQAAMRLYTPPRTLI